MAFTLTSRGLYAGTYITSLNPVSDTFTPSTDELLLVYVGSSRASGASLTAVTAPASWGCTFSQLYDTGITSANRFEVWGAFVTGSTPASGALQFTSQSISCAAGTIQIAGADASGTLAAAFIQETDATGYNQATSLALGALSTFASEDNLCLTLGQNADSSKSFTPQTGFTELQDGNGGGSNCAIGAFYQTGTETSPTVDYATTAYEYTRGISMEIAADGGGGGGTTIPIFTRHIQQMKQR